MILSKRIQRSPSHTSYPMNSELAPCVSSPELLASPPATPPRGHKHTLSKMSWLSRSSSSASSHFIPHAAPKPTRISEPKLGSSIEHFNLHRSGPLGSGATIVRTPQEALSSSFRAPELINEEEGVKGDVLLHDTEENESRLLPPLPSSPPLPPLPDISDVETGDLRQSVSSTSVPLSDHVPHPRSSSPASPALQRSSSRPTLLAFSCSPCSIPALPADIDPIPSQPPFEAILLSSTVPDGATDPSKLIVTLETCTTTYRTSLRSLTSRPSHLSRYVMSLLSPASETASIYSNTSEASLAQHSNWFNSVFRDHLASSGCLPQSSTGIHVFLDRPSAPYTHVLAYLRSLPSTPEQPETLPRAVQLGSMSPSPLESLLELRDEASYLGLAELYTLCCREIDRFHRSGLQTSADGIGMLVPRGKTGSVHSFHTLVEQCQPHAEAQPSELPVSKRNGGALSRTAKSATRESSSNSSCENKDVLVRERSRQVRGIKYEMGSPPPGWI